jgi:RHS repeat-associated protein
LDDALGSTAGLVGSAQTIATSYTYQPFGATTVSGANNGNVYEFTGRENDGTGLYYYRARYYQPADQRFIVQDPSELDGGDPNLYGYVSENPINFSDPLGLGRFTRPCGRCILIYDSDQFKGAHTHWKCPGQPQGCVLKNGQPCDGSPPPPPDILKCLQDFNRVPSNFTCGHACQELIVGGLVIFTCAVAPELTPAFAF